MDLAGTKAEGEMWIFGYGSLVWKAGFPYENRVVGFIEGYVRRFWQASVDHRGTRKMERVWGVAYKVRPGAEAETWTYLGVREVTYGPAQKGLFFPKTMSTAFPGASDNAAIPVHIYMAPCDGPLFLGPTNPRSAAVQILSCAGPSGSNLDYFQRLLNFLRTECPLDSVDEHMLEIERAILALCLSPASQQPQSC